MPRPSVVLDTNVVVSAHLNSDGYERFALDLGIARKIQLYLSADILNEYRGVLQREKFGLAPERVVASIKLIEESAKMVVPIRKITASRDPEDNKFLECASEAAADYLVTGNKRHFPARSGRTRVVNARELLEEIIPTLTR